MYDVAVNKPRPGMLSGLAFNDIVATACSLVPIELKEGIIANPT